MTKIANGRRVPGGALPKSTRVDNRAIASMAKSASASFVSQTAPGRRSESAMPAATPTLVMRSRTPRNTIETVDRVSMLANVDAACNARFAGFQIVRMKIRNRIPTGMHSE